MRLSGSELLRYHRQQLIRGWNQEKLDNARVFIAGLGGLGGASSQYLTAAGVGRITLCDSDRLELSNLNRQILYSTYEIGDHKADKAKGRLKALNPEIEIESIVEKISESNYINLIREHHIIVDGMDNYETRLLLNRASLHLGIPYVYAAVNENIAQIAFFNPPKTACLSCLIPQAGTESRPIPIYGAMPGMAGSFQALLTIKYLLTGENPLPDQIALFNGETIAWEKISFSKNSKCPVCAGA